MNDELRMTEKEGVMTNTKVSSIISLEELRRIIKKLQSGKAHYGLKSTL
jgi:hypothetical protein